MFRRHILQFAALLAAVCIMGRSANARADAVELRYARGGYFPTGMGSQSYTGNYEILVDNLGYSKQVSIYGRLDANSPWLSLPASYAESVPGNREIWRITAYNQPVTEFVVKYTVNGTTYWDNNGGTNYYLPIGYGESKMVIGKPQVVGGPYYFDTLNLNVSMAVRNLGYSKVVGVMYTTDNWASTRTANATYSYTGSADTEVWSVSLAIGSATNVKYAVFYKVNGQSYWDSSFGRNFSATR